MPKGIVVAGLSGGSGKSIVAVGLVAAYARQGNKVVPFKKGPDYIAVLKQELEEWLEEHEYESVAQMKGSVSRSCAINPAALEHSNYMHVIKSYGK